MQRLESKPVSDIVSAKQAESINYEGGTLPRSEPCLETSVVLPTTRGTLYAVMNRLWKITVRDEPDFHAIEHQIKELKPYHSIEHDSLEVSPETVDICHSLLKNKIQTLQSSLRKAAEAFTEDLPSDCQTGSDFDSRLRAIEEGVINLARRHALRVFIPPSGYDSKELPMSLQCLVDSTASHLLLFGMIDRGFSVAEFETWFKLAAEIWKKEVFPRCLDTNSDGSEYFFGDFPTFFYSPDLEKNSDLNSLRPDFSAHAHLGHIRDATIALKLLSADISTTRELLGKNYSSFLKGRVLLQELYQEGRYSPSLTFGRAEHEGAPGIEIAFHPDRPTRSAEQPLGKVSVRFLDETTPIIVACQGLSTEKLWSSSAYLCKDPSLKTSNFTHDMYSLFRNMGKPDVFFKFRRNMCSSVGVRQATDAAMLAAIIVLKHLGFRSVCGISDADQHPLIDLHDIQGQGVAFYDPLFARLGFQPPKSESERFWTLPLETIGVWNDSQFCTFNKAEDYFAVVLARQSTKGEPSPVSWNPDVRLKDSSKQLSRFREYLLSGAIELAQSIKNAAPFQRLSL